MKIMNQKGFLLIETLIVAVFIMAIFIFIYNNAVPIIADFQKQQTYDDLDSVYAVGLVKDMVRTDSHLATFIAGITTEKPYNDISDCTKYDDSAFCTNLKTLLNINASSVVVGGKTIQADRILIVNHNISALQTAINTEATLNASTERGIREYITNLEDFSYAVGNNTNNYRIIITRTIVNGQIATKKYSNIEVIL